MTIFEWDKKKNQANIAKHGVSFGTARKAFLDPARIILPDNKHSQTEERHMCIGKTNEGIISVVFTYRKTTIRIISAGFWRKWRKVYEKSL